MKRSAYRRRYARVYAWFTARPAALAVLRGATRVLPLAVAVCYGVLLARQGLAWYRATRWSVLFTAAEADAAGALFRSVLLVPAAALLLGTLLRRCINAPRPYDAPGFTPLLEKETKGRSFPSRHALSAGVIAAAWLAVFPPMGLVLLVLAAGVCLTRVLAGVHYPLDVAAGLLLGLAFGLLGMWL